MSGYSAEYRNAVMLSEETMIRTISRKLSITALISDAVCWVYMFIWLCYFCNFLRLPKYEPGQFRPWNDFTFWRIGVPVGFYAMLPFACITLVYYRTPIPFGVFIFLALIVLIWGGVTQGYLIADWISCCDRLWCPCVTSFTQTLGVITYTVCAGEGCGTPSGPFLAHFSCNSPSSFTSWVS